MEGLIENNISGWGLAGNRLAAFQELYELSAKYGFGFIDGLARFVNDQSEDIVKRTYAAKEIRRQMVSKCSLIQNVKSERWSRGDIQSIVLRLFTAMESVKSNTQLNLDYLDSLYQTLSALLSAYSNSFSVSDVDEFRKRAWDLFYKDDEIQLKENPEKTTPEASTSQAVMINMADKDDPMDGQSKTKKIRISRIVELGIVALKLLEILHSDNYGDANELKEFIGRGFRDMPLRTTEDVMIKLQRLVLKTVERVIKKATEFHAETVKEIFRCLTEKKLLACENDNICIAALELMVEIASKDQLHDCVTNELHQLLLAFDWLEYYEQKSIAVSNLLKKLFDML